jgi:hypothetical protein
MYGVQNYTNNLKLVMEDKSNPNKSNQIKTEKKVIDKNKTTKNYVWKAVDEYQIIYKVKEKQDDTELNNLNEKDYSAPTFFAQKEANVKPRGISTGFLEKQKTFSSSFSPSLTSGIHKKYRKDYFPSKKLEFGFSPLPPVSKPSEIYFYANIDTLHAPSDNSYYNKNNKRSSNVVRSSNIPVKRRDKQSNLDFWGIFDTRRYFFIPPNRRSETIDGGIFSDILSIFSK